MLFETPVNIDFAGYANNNTPYKCSLHIENVLDWAKKIVSLVFNK